MDFTRVTVFYTFFLLTFSQLNLLGVPIAMLASFKRVKNISNDLHLILTALKESNILEVSQDQLKVRRQVPFTGFIKADKDENTIYANGFSKTTSIEDMKEYFSQFGTVCSTVLIRPVTDPKYKGAAFIEFSSIEETSRVLNVQHIHDGKQINVSLKRIQTKQSKSKKKSKTKSELNRVIYFSGVDPSISHSIIKESFLKFVEVTFVDYRRDETTGHVRLKKPLAQQTVERLQQMGFSIGTEVVQLKALTESEEKIYWSVVKEFEPLPSTSHRTNPRTKPPRGVARNGSHKHDKHRQNAGHPYNRPNKRVDGIRKMMENMHFSPVQS
ncbi:hypothetical protein K7432_011597 [Basidiobolus ranarum]|uniref:Uncharacterized protein n=1 Tax=Basidiobolus ranarum TaxID=34480 RepID=A0ABR2VU24_9FUNG